jgi:hypothetical protein
MPSTRGADATASRSPVASSVHVLLLRLTFHITPHVPVVPTCLDDDCDMGSINRDTATSNVRDSVQL